MPTVLLPLHKHLVLRTAHRGLRHALLRHTACQDGAGLRLVAKHHRSLHGVGQ